MHEHTFSHIPAQRTNTQEDKQTLISSMLTWLHAHLPMHAHPILECHSLFTMQFWWMPTAATPSTRTTDDLHATLASVAHCTVNSFHDCGILRS